MSAVKVCHVKFNQHVSLGAGNQFDGFDLRGKSKETAFLSSMEYEPSTGEVVAVTTPRCPLSKGSIRRLRFPACAVVFVMEADDVVVKVEAKRVA